MVPKKVLVVDDEVDIADILSEEVRNMGHECDEAHNGTEAWNKALKTRYDLIVSDFNMPNLSGLEFLKCLREERIYIPLICLTGRGSQELHRDYWTHGAFEYLEKPLRLEDFRKAVKEALAANLADFESNTVTRVRMHEINLLLPKSLVTLAREASLSRGQSLTTYLQETLEREFGASATVRKASGDL